MPLESANVLMQKAVAGRYAVGYFESWNLESLQGVVDAAEASRSPVIVGFGGEVLSRRGRLGEERLAWYAALGKAAADSASVPCGLILNECSRADWVRQAVALGFNLVMYTPATEDSRALTREIADFARYAHSHGVAVEAELDTLPCGISAELTEGSVTDPRRAAELVAATGIDLLAVSVGNVHIALHGTQALDVDRIAAIRKAVTVPLVLHGGSGIEPDSLREAIAAGIAKVNFGTSMKLRYLSALRKTLDTRQKDPHRLLGHGGEEDLLVAGRLAVRDAVLEKMQVLGCCGKA